MKEQIEKILKFVELAKERKDLIANYDDLKYQVSVLFMNEIFANSINEGMKVTLLNTVSSVLFNSVEKAIFSKSQYDWATFYSIVIGGSKILFDPVKDFVQITDATTEKENENIILYKCSKDVMTRTVSGEKEVVTIVYDEIGMQKNKIIRGITLPGDIAYEEHLTRDNKESCLIYFDETLDNKESFSASIKKVARIWELDTNASYVYQGNESDLDAIYAQVIENLNEETEYKYFPDFKKRILELLEIQFIDIPNRVRER